MLILDLVNWFVHSIVSWLVKLINYLLYDRLGSLSEVSYVIEKPLTQCHAVLQILVC